MGYFNGIFQNLRFYLLLTSAILAAGIYLLVKTVIPDGTLQIIRLTQIYAFGAVGFLYLALLVTPLTRTFPRIPFRAKYLFLRRAIGVSAFMFALLHVCFAFFGQLGGFAGLPFLPGNYLISILFGFFTLTIVFLMAVTSFDWAIDKMTFPRWKMLHRLVYLAGISIIIHALRLGTHFMDLSQIIPRTIFIALVFLIGLEVFRIDKNLQNRYPTWPGFGLIFIIFVLIVGFLAKMIFFQID